MEEPPKQNEMLIGEAVTEITALMEIEIRKGAVDDEPGRFRTIIDNLKQRRISPQEAVTQAHEIGGGRQDYH